jgi:two-component system, OmpR family, phosphate regulon sensor histidine kinase PhoR
LTGRIFVKLIAGVLFLLLLALVTVDYFATKVARDSYIQNLKSQLAGKARILGLAAAQPGGLESGRIRDLARAAGGRITVVRSDGTVIVDSEANAAEMENHRTPTRPELLAAFRGQVGSNQRTSATLGVSFLYVAVPFDAGTWHGALRIAEPLSEVDAGTRQIRWRILAGTSASFLPAFFIAALLARWISRRFAAIMTYAGELSRGNFRARLSLSGASEFAQLSQTLNETAAKLEQTVEQLEAEHAELEKVERIRKDFVINVSHELRTPLASIQGYTETLMDGALDDPDHNMRFLGIIRHNAERLARLTADLLTLSRIEQKRQNLEFESHSVNALIQEAVDVIRPIAEKSSIHLATEPAPDLSLVWCDVEAVSQVLSNLLDNAIKYTPSGGTITVGARPGERFVELYVRDTGSGIPAEDLPRLFERFYRVDKARSRELGGTGLGLSIVKHLVALHGGSVRVESRVNEGSTFFFSLPVDEADLGNPQLNPEFIAS